MHNACPCRCRRPDTNRKSGRVYDGQWAAYSQLSSSGEVLAVFVETDGHYSVGGVKRLLYAISVVYVNINVEHTGMISVEDFSREAR